MRDRGRTYQRALHACILTLQVSRLPRGAHRAGAERHCIYRVPRYSLGRDRARVSARVHARERRAAQSTCAGALWDADEAGVVCSCLGRLAPATARAPRDVRAELGPRGGGPSTPLLRAGPGIDRTPNFVGGHVCCSHSVCCARTSGGCGTPDTNVKQASLPRSVPRAGAAALSLSLIHI